MKQFSYIFMSALCAGSLSLLTSCDDLFEPAIENNLGQEEIVGNPTYFDGVLGNAYTRVPGGSYSMNDVATDDAVSNDADNTYRKMATGTWTSQTNPIDRWQSLRGGVLQANTVLAGVDQVTFATDELVNTMFRDRVKGEALALRAIFNFYLLQAHGGIAADGQLLGIPLVTEAENAQSDFNQSRNTFAECVSAIEADLKEAIGLLPTDYKEITATGEAQKQYAGATVAQYNRVFGQKFTGRMTGRIAEAFLAKTALLAASPAFEQSGTTWEQAANYAGTVIDRVGGAAGLDPTGNTWYANTADIANLSVSTMPAEVLWYSQRSNSNSLESDNFPPSLYGKGQVNPTQNLVDAFPAANGYPITEAASGYNAQNPYEGRDPRLALYIIYNGSQAGVNNTAINTQADNTGLDGLNREDGASTRTGYYMKKLLRQDVNLDPTTKTEQYHYTPRLRYTELFLDYAEAANEAWGPQGKGSHQSSAYDVVKAIRQRAGLAANGTDDYLESIKDDKDKMRQLIRNERRLELCFEGFRFFDLRRWNANLTEGARGMSITTVAGTTAYEPLNVENRAYQDYQVYGPIPYTEVLKFSNLQQNRGW